MVQQVFGVGTVAVLPPSFQMETHQDVQWTSTVLIFMDYSKNKVLQQCMSDLCVCGRFRVDGDSKYLTLVQELVRPERNTLTVSFRDVETFNQQLSTTLLEEYYRWAWDLSSSTCSLHWMALLGSWKWKSQMYSMVVYLWSWLSAADPLWSPRPFQQQCKHGSLGPVQFRSIQDGICVLVKSHVHSTLSLRSFPNIASAVSLLPCVGDKIVDHSLGFVGLFWMGSCLFLCVCGRPRWCSWAYTWQWPICSRVCVNIYWVQKQQPAIGQTYWPVFCLTGSPLPHQPLPHKNKLQRKNVWFLLCAF